MIEINGASGRWMFNPGPSRRLPTTNFIMLTRLNTDAVRSPRRLEQLERRVMGQVRVLWLGSYAVLGPYDYVDIFQADSIETATRVSALIRTFRHAQTEILPTEWSSFKDIVRTLGDTE